MPTARFPGIACSLLLTFAGSNVGAQDDALNLESAPAEVSSKTGSSANAKISVETAIGNASQRYRSGSIDSQRASVDLSYASPSSTGLRLTFSDRLDMVHPKTAGGESVVNSLREAYVSWQSSDAGWLFDLGRINLRNGPAYGYNPTDFFRDGSLRILTSADPFVLRQNRIGSVMVRAQRIWDGGSLSLIYSPKVASRPSLDGWSLDLGSTNNRDRALLGWSNRFSEHFNGQAVLFKDGSARWSLGANMTALLSDAATAQMEWTHSREPDLRSRANPLGAQNVMSRNRLSVGMTYTTLAKTSITAEYQYNGFGVTKAGWDAMATVPGAQLGYLQEGLRRQELGSRRAVLFYVTQKGFGLQDLDLTGYVRLNLEDRSKLAWIELRHHWRNFDLSLQLQRNIGRPGTEFGILQDRRVFQVLGVYYF